MIITQENCKRYTQDNMGARFKMNGNPCTNLKLAARAAAQEEPDWMKLSFVELVAAERMAIHRLSGGEEFWRGVLKRIRTAKYQKRPMIAKKRR